MKKHRNKIITGIIIAAVLVSAFWWGGDAPGLHGWDSGSGNGTDTAQTHTSGIQDADDVSGETDDLQTVSGDDKKDGEDASEENKPGNTDSTPMTSDEKISLAEEIAESSGTDTAARPSSTGRPESADSGDAVISDRELTCTLSVRCDSILNNISWLDEDKVSLVPKNGVIFAEQTVTFYEGESVFNLLVREMKRNKIHLEFENTPIYNSAYIEGIGNIYEFDCGELSGWMYKVNGWFPDYGCSRYQLKQNDRVEWVYTCNLGADVGGYYSTKNGYEQK